KALNPAAWSDALPGQFGTAAGYYNNYRWQRQPAESLAIGRTFVMSRERNINLNIRGEVTNLFNRTYFNAPTTIGAFANLVGANPVAPVTPNGAGGFNGFGYVNNVNGLGS